MSVSKIITKYLVPNWETLILVFVVLYLLYRYSVRNHNYWKNRGVPFEKPVFLAGSLWEVFKGQTHIGKHLGHLYSKYDTPYFGIYIMGKPYLVLRDPNIVKTITIKNFVNFDDRTFACDKNADKMSGNSLFILRNPDWKNIRNKLTPIFTLGKLKLMFPIMKQCSREMLVYLGKHQGEVLDIKEVSAKFMTDLVASCFFGLEINSFGERESEFRLFCKKMLDFDVYRSFCLFSYFFVPKFVSWFKLKLLDSSLLQKIFHETLSQRKQMNMRRNDFVDLLLQVKDNFRGNSTHFDTDTMVSQAITFFIAGFETTSNALAFALYELSLRQDCQDKLRDEIVENIHSQDDLTFENIQKMKYLDMVLSETLRRYPFGPFLNRKCKEDYVVKETGLVIEKDTPVLIPIDGIHNDPEYYPEPERFDPDRFADGHKAKSQACTYLPFGMGPRNCIGDRFGLICAKVGLVCFLKDFKVKRCQDTPVPLVLNPKSPFMMPIGGLKMIVEQV